MSFSRIGDVGASASSLLQKDEYLKENGIYVCTIDELANSKAKFVKVKQNEKGVYYSPSSPLTILKTGTHQVDLRTGERGSFLLWIEESFQVIRWGIPKNDPLPLISSDGLAIGMNGEFVYEVVDLEKFVDFYKQEVEQNSTVRRKITERINRLILPSVKTSSIAQLQAINEQGLIESLLDNITTSNFEKIGVNVVSANILGIVIPDIVDTEVSPEVFDEEEDQTTVETAEIEEEVVPVEETDIEPTDTVQEPTKPENTLLEQQEIPPPARPNWLEEYYFNEQREKTIRINAVRAVIQQQKQEIEELEKEVEDLETYQNVLYLDGRTLKEEIHKVFTNMGIDVRDSIDRKVTELEYESQDRYYVIEIRNTMTNTISITNELQAVSARIRQKQIEVVDKNIPAKEIKGVLIVSQQFLKSPKERKSLKLDGDTLQSIFTLHPYAIISVQQLYAAARAMHEKQAITSADILDLFRDTVGIVSHPELYIDNYPAFPIRP